MSLLALYQAIEKNDWVDLPAGWLQGRTLYGGLAAAMLMHKARSTIQDEQQKLLSCSVTFVGPIEQAQVKLTAEVLRKGRSVTSVEVRLWQNDAVQTIMLASFGAMRESSLMVDQEKSAPELTPINDLKVYPLHPLAPECMKQMQLVWAEGAPPCTASTEPDFAGWMRFHPEMHDNRDMTLTDLMIAFDMWPPGVLPMLKQIAPASSLTWQLTYLNPLQNKIHDWMKYKVFTDSAKDGYSTEYAHLWDANNRLIAIARQTVTVFA